MVAFGFLMAAIVLGASYLALSCKIKEYNRLCSHGQNVFQKEQRNLLVVLGVFSVSYVLRTVFDLWVGTVLFHRNFHAFVLVINLLSLIFDIIPVSLVLVSHLKNFRASDEYVRTETTKSNYSSINVPVSEFERSTTSAHEQT